MSDFKKNILKAGFLVTASLLATGCSDDNKTGSPSSPNTQPPAAGSSTGTTASLVATFTPDLAGAEQKLKGSGLGIVALGSVDTYGTGYNVFQHVQPVESPLGLSSGAPTPSGAV